MRNILKQIIASVLLTFTLSCTNSGTGQSKLPGRLPKSGIIHEKIACLGDQGKSYALYFPTLPPATAQTVKSLARNHLYPVMIAFDPHGDGVLPVKLYMDLAEKYGFILVGSNDSKNGLPGDQVNGIVNTLMHEVRSVYPVDTNLIYLLGFSGGARVASMAAMYQVPVKGVIACGAGFGSIELPIRFKFDYFGIVGTADFNMTEMLQLNEPLSRDGIRHFIATFPGIHAWPPGWVMEDGFRWITLNAMKNGFLKKDDVFISGVISEFENRIKELKSNNNLVAAVDACREVIFFVDGLASTGEIKKELMTLEKRPDFQSQNIYHLKVMKMEEAEKQELIQAMQVQDLRWWKAKIKNYELGRMKDEFKKKNISTEDSLKDRRLLAFLSLFCYMNVNAVMTQQNEPAAVKIIAIYEMADPSNPEPNYIHAILLARKSEKEAAFVQLKIAIVKGFSDKKRLTLQPEFRSMNILPALDDLMKTIK